MTRPLFQLRNLGIHAGGVPSKTCQTHIRIVVWIFICIICAAIAYNRKSAVHIIDGNLNAVQYRDQILEPIAIPFGLATVGKGFIIQDNNARPQRARIIEEFHENHMEYTHMQWPAYSPDVNPIEHDCDIVGRDIRALDEPPRMLEDLALALVEQWAAIPQRKIQKLFRSMRARCDSVIAANGGATIY